MYYKIYNSIKYPFIIIINKISRNNKIMDNLEIAEIKSNKEIKE